MNKQGGIFFLIAILFTGIVFGDELPQKTLDEIKAQTEKVEDKISSDWLISVDDVLTKSKNATEKVLAEQVCLSRGEIVNIFMIFVIF